MLTFFSATTQAAPSPPLSTFTPGRQQEPRIKQQQQQQEEYPVFSDDRLWPGGRIPYFITGNFSWDETNTIIQAMRVSTTVCFQKINLFIVHLVSADAARRAGMWGKDRICTYKFK
jgi:hypothetical protein